MSKPIITVENLSKRYDLGQIGATTLRDSAQRFVDRLRRRRPVAISVNGYPLSGKTTDNQKLLTNNRTNGAPNNQQPITNNDNSPSEFWALKDVSFEVQPGEVLGIIGRNGAGKSTLLKILSRITEPTSGRAIIRGRVASLLEVGTGFHPELSGRENIYLNGAILGMRHAEIATKFDEIVDFAEIEEFIDTPVKRYSSGMYVRLAFAVAAHLEPEILVVDEVLAVGDAEFQKKCMGKMRNVALAGRTVLLVSHNMSAIRSLCDRGMTISHGLVSCLGSADDAVDSYFKEAFEVSSQIEIADRKDRRGTGVVRVIKMSVAFDQARSSWVLKVEYKSEYAVWHSAHLLISINSVRGDTVTFLDSACMAGLPRDWPANGGVEIQLSPDVLLTAGDYVCNVACLIGAELVDHVTEAFAMHVSENALFDWRARPISAGVCYIRQQWSLTD
jgi:lipopolysaccharide transport system ATP-binding protein